MVLVSPNVSQTCGRVRFQSLDVYVNIFFPHTARLWNSFPMEHFPLIYDLNGFKYRINSHLLTVDSF